MHRKFFLGGISMGTNDYFRNEDITNLENFRKYCHDNEDSTILLNDNTKITEDIKKALNRIAKAYNVEIKYIY